MAIFVKFFSDKNLVEPFSIQVILQWIIINKNDLRRELDNFMEYLKKCKYEASKFINIIHIQIFNLMLYTGTRFKYLLDVKKVIMCYNENRRRPFGSGYTSATESFIKRIAKGLKIDIKNSIIKVFYIVYIFISFNNTL